MLHVHHSDRIGVTVYCSELNAASHQVKDSCARYVAIAKAPEVCVLAQDRFLQRRAGGTQVSNGKRPGPFPATRQQGLGSAPKRPAFNVLVTHQRPAQQGLHAAADKTGYTSDEGKTMMLGEEESQPLNTPFRYGPSDMLFKDLLLL